MLVLQKRDRDVLLIVSQHCKLEKMGGKRKTEAPTELSLINNGKKLSNSGVSNHGLFTHGLEMLSKFNYCTLLYMVT